MAGMAGGGTINKKEGIINEVKSEENNKVNKKPFSLINTNPIHIALASMGLNLRNS